MLSIAGNPIDSPRHYLDGQIYTLDYQLENVPPDAAAQGPFAFDVIYVHLRDHFEIPEKPVWGDISEIMTQFGNLYPIMSKYVVDLKDPNAVITKKDILIFAFTRDINDPLYMPVTRDLSEGKRRTIVKWLQDPKIEKAVSIETEVKTEAAAEAPAAAPIKSDIKLTEKQLRLKEAARLKGGAEAFSFGETGNVPED